VASPSSSLFGGELSLLWPIVSILSGVVLTLGLWVGMRRRVPDVTEQTGPFGLLVVFGQILDATSTLVGIDVLGFTENVYLSRLIIDATARLPLAELLGTVWLFVVIKSALVVGILTLIARTEDTSHPERRLLLAVVFVAGFGPALNNLQLQLLV